MRFSNEVLYVYTIDYQLSIKIYGINKVGTLAYLNATTNTHLQHHYITFSRMMLCSEDKFSRYLYNNFNLQMNYYPHFQCDLFLEEHMET